MINAGRTGLFCPCVLFGKNVETMKEEIPWENACVCHAIFVEGGITAAAGTLLFHGIIDPQTTCLLFEGLLFAWWMCGIYTGLFRQTLQKKYHLKVKLIVLIKKNSQAKPKTLSVVFIMGVILVMCGLGFTLRSVFGALLFALVCDLSRTQRDEEPFNRGSYRGNDCC